MNKQWVIGRYADGRWKWMAKEGFLDEFTREFDEVGVFDTFEEALSWHGETDGECILTLEAAKAIAERWG